MLTLLEETERGIVYCCCGVAVLADELDFPDLPDLTLLAELDTERLEVERAAELRDAALRG